MVVVQAQGSRVATSPNPTPAASQDGTTRPAGPPTATRVSWNAGHVTGEHIATLLERAGLGGRVLPPAPATLLLFNAEALDLVGVDDASVKGLSVYRYGDAQRAENAFALPPVQDPMHSTISWVAKPYFVLVGDAIVNFGTDDAGAAGRLIDALTNPRVSAVGTVVEIADSTSPGFRRLTVTLAGRVEWPASALAGTEVTLTTVPATAYVRTGGPAGSPSAASSAVETFEEVGVRVGQSVAVTFIVGPETEAYVVLHLGNLMR
ncbi:MAG: hypothetical protein ACRDGT_06340 [Candidatus Limnocylindria bacterium]